MYNKDKDYYEILEISPNASAKMIKRARNTLQQLCHADKGSASSSHIRSQLINEAYAVLSDESQRLRYDRCRIAYQSEFEKKVEEAADAKKAADALASKIAQEAHEYKQRAEKAEKKADEAMRKVKQSEEYMLAGHQAFEEVSSSNDTLRNNLHEETQLRRYFEVEYSRSKEELKHAKQKLDKNSETKSNICKAARLLFYVPLLVAGVIGLLMSLVVFCFSDAGQSLAFLLAALASPLSWVSYKSIKRQPVEEAVA